MPQRVYERLMEEAMKSPLNAEPDMETCCSRFTAAEGGARLAAVANNKNIIITEHCTFVATRLLHEDAYKIRGLLSEGRQRSIFLTRSSRIAYVAYELGILTDLAIAKSANYEDVTDWKVHLEEKEVIVCTSRILKCILEDGYLNMLNINVLVIDSCHLISTDDDLKYVMRLYKECTETNRPRLLSLTYPIFTSINYDNDAIKDEEINRENKSDLKQIENNESIHNLDKTVLVNEIIDTKDIEDEKDKKGIDTITDKDGNKSNDFEESDSSKVIDKSTDEIDNSNENTIDEIIKSELKDEKIPISDITENVLDIESATDSTDRTIACMNTDKNLENIIKDKLISKEKDKKEISLGVYENVDDFEMYEKLGWKIEELEKDLNCEMDLAEDIDGGKRLSTAVSKPKEVIIEYSKQISVDNLPEVYKDLDLFMRKTIQDGIDFINEHSLIVLDEHLFGWLSEILQHVTCL
ncbi:Endoribonuclease Dicer [Papilio machaon]|uniref:Endoribonuclease Dicer n=1 Tax=Papilio machaon TaxID=76193 RepID=A0A0N0PCH5_PAPMA|nr:Endoribonuclease Dicer [Papilio machaon]